MMGWRYRKSVKIAPGVRLNFTNRGVSATVGPRGGSVSISRRGTYLNQSIPFLGISRRVKLNRRSIAAPPESSGPAYAQLPPEFHSWWGPHKALRDVQAALEAEPAQPDDRENAGRLLNACQGGLLRDRVRGATDWEALRDA